MNALVRREAPPAPIDTGGAQYLTFLLGGEPFAMGIPHIREIIEYGHLTPVPMMPAHVRGVINLRGAVVPVVDLAARLGRAAAAITRRSCIVIVEAGEEVVGAVVDAVSEVLELPGHEIEPAPAFGARIRPDFIAGMGKLDGRFVVILDVDRVLGVDELALPEAP